MMKVSWMQGVRLKNKQRQKDVESKSDMSNVDVFMWSQTRTSKTDQVQHNNIPPI